MAERVGFEPAQAPRSVAAVGGRAVARHSLRVPPGLHSCTYARLSNRRPCPFFSSKMTLELTSRHPVRRRCNCPGLTVSETSRILGERIVTVASDAPPL